MSKKRVTGYIRIIESNDSLFYRRRVVLVDRKNDIVAEFYPDMEITVELGYTDKKEGIKGYSK